MFTLFVFEDRLYTLFCTVQQLVTGPAPAHSVFKSSEGVFKGQISLFQTIHRRFQFLKSGFKVGLLVRACNTHTISDGLQSFRMISVAVWAGVRC